MLSLYREVFMREVWNSIRYNIQRVLQSDPAATSWFMVVWTYPHITALFWHFFAHRLYRKGWFTLARRVALHARRVTGIEIHPGAQIGKGLFIDHGMGVVIGETAIVGDNVTLFHGVTLGGMDSRKIKRHPTVEDDVLIGAGTKVLGDIMVGKGSKIGCNLVIKRDVPRNVIIFETEPDHIIYRRPKVDRFDKGSYVPRRHALPLEPNEFTDHMAWHI